MKNILATISLASLVSLVMAIATGWLFVDGRYVHAAEFKKYATQQTSQFNAMRKAMTENELFRLELTPVDKRSDADRALIERHKRQLVEINEASRNGRGVE